MPRFIHTTTAPTQRQIRAALPFGLLLAPAAHAVNDLGLSIQPVPGRITLLTGPSGSGKTTALRHLHCSLLARAPHTLAPMPRQQDRTLLIDALGPRLDVRTVLRTLATFGLAEPALVARRLCELSQGQRHRADLAIAFTRALAAARACKTTIWWLIDEFASVLDRTTARSVASTLARAVADAPLRVVVATAHDDLAEALRADPVVRFDLRGSSGIFTDVPAPADTIAIEPGVAADLDALLPHHYLAGRPATRVGFLRAWDRASDELAGVLVVSRPTLNGGWRNLAWPGRFTGRDRRAAARTLNRDLRCISRVIIDPRYRGLGLARRLVEHYLANPQTPATEAIAAVGEICPFFERAGMTPYPLPRHAADARLEDALESVGASAWMLAARDRAPELIAQPLIARELARWALHRGAANSDSLAQAQAAAARLCGRPVAYAHVFPPSTTSAHEARRGTHDSPDSAARSRSRAISAASASPTSST
jgi:ABC-type lipoprotein export system ATPase subunit/GNAT superfamily N-acetyltransferase